MRVLITGGSGFIGSYFYDPLHRAGHSVVNLDLVDPSPQAAASPYLKGDVRDPDALNRAMQGCDAVLHLAAAHHDFGIDRDTYFSVNEGAAHTIADAMDQHGIRELVFYSTCAVYGSAPEPHHEHSPTQPISPYGQSKLAGEAVFRQWAERGDNRRCLVIRPTVTFGPRNFANMYSLIRQIRSGRFVQVGAGSNIKSLSYVENIVDATLFLWSRPAAERLPFDVFNFIDKPDLTSRQITEQVCKALAKKPPGMTIPMWAACLLVLPFDIVIKLTGKNLPVSSARVRKLFEAQTRFEADKLRDAGYKPLVPLTEGIRRMVQWYLDEGKDQQAVWHIPPANPIVAD